LNRGDIAEADVEVAGRPFAGSNDTRLQAAHQGGNAAMVPEALNSMEHADREVLALKTSSAFDQRDGRGAGDVQGRRRQPLFGAISVGRRFGRDSWVCDL